LLFPKGVVRQGKPPVQFFHIPIEGVLDRGGDLPGAVL